MTLLTNNYNRNNNTTNYGTRYLYIVITNESENNLVEFIE